MLLVVVEVDEEEDDDEEDNRLRFELHCCSLFCVALSPVNPDEVETSLQLMILVYGGRSL